MVVRRMKRACASCAPRAAPLRAAAAAVVGAIDAWLDALQRRFLGALVLLGVCGLGNACALHLLVKVLQEQR